MSGSFCFYSIEDIKGILLAGGFSQILKLKLLFLFATTSLCNPFHVGGVRKDGTVFHWNLEDGSGVELTPPKVGCCFVFTQCWNLKEITHASYMAPCPLAH